MMKRYIGIFGVCFVIVGVVGLAYFVLFGGGVDGLVDTTNPQASGPVTSQTETPMPCLETVFVDANGSGDERTIQDGVDRTCADGTVYVNKSEKMYEEAVVVETAGISIVANSESDSAGFTDVPVRNVGSDPVFRITAENVTIKGLQIISKGNTGVAIEGSNATIDRILARVDGASSSSTAIHVGETASGANIRRSQTYLSQRTGDGSATSKGVGIRIDGDGVRVGETFAGGSEAYRVNGDAVITNSSKTWGDVVIQSGTVELREMGLGMLSGVVVEPRGELALTMKNNHLKTAGTPLTFADTSTDEVSITVRENVFQRSRYAQSDGPLVVNQRSQTIDVTRNFWRNGKRPEVDDDYSGLLAVEDHRTSKPNVRSPNGEWNYASS